LKTNMAHPRDYGLLLWYLIHRIPVNRKRLWPSHIKEALRHCKMPMERLEECRRRWPRLWASMLKRRRRRLDYWLKHGDIPEGWTPPDPNNPKTAADVTALREYAHSPQIKRRALRHRGMPAWRAKHILAKLERLRQRPPKTYGGHMRALTRIEIEAWQAMGFNV